MSGGARLLLALVALALALAWAMPEDRTCDRLYVPVAETWREAG